MRAESSRSAVAANPLTALPTQFGQSVWLDFIRRSLIIQGELKTAGGGNTEAHFWGGVMAKNATLDTQNISGKATLNYSSCSILATLLATSQAAMMRSRGWVQLY